MPAERFGASPLVIGLLFASFSVSQLVAAPVLGELSDRIGRRPVLLFSLIGTVEIAAIARAKIRTHLPLVVDVASIAQKAKYSSAVACAPLFRITVSLPRLVMIRGRSRFHKRPSVSRSMWS